MPLYEAFTSALEIAVGLLVVAINIDTTYHFDTEAGWRIFNNSSSENSWQFSGLGKSNEWAANQNNWKLGWSKVFTILSPTLESNNHTIGFDLSNPDRLLWATNQFVFGAQQVTQNNGSKTLDFENLATTGSTTANWSSTGLDNITPFILDVNAENPNVIYAGLNDLGCTVSDDKGATWKLCIHNSDEWPSSFTSEGVSYGGVTTALVSDPGNAEIVWMFAAGDQGDPVFPMQSTTSGASWSVYDNNWQSDQNPSTPDIYGLSVDASSGTPAQRLYVTVAGAVYRSEDSGEHWDEVFACDSGCRVTEAAAGGSVVYAGGEAGLFVSFNNGATWSTVLNANQVDGHFTEFTGNDDDRPQVFSRHDWSGVSGIAIDPQVPQIVYAAVFNTDSSQGIYKCDVSGSISCTPLPLDSAFVRDVAIDTHNSQNLFATSSSAYTSGGFDEASTGVWRSTNGGSSWLTMNDGLDWPMAIPIVVDSTNSNRVYTGSPGGGNYRIDLDNQVPPAATLLDPTGSISDSTPMYRWNSVENSSWHYIWIKDQSGVKFKRWYTTAQAGCSRGVGVCSVEPTAPVKQWTRQLVDTNLEFPRFRALEQSNELCN